MSIAKHAKNKGGNLVGVESARHEHVEVLIVYLEPLDHFSVVDEVGELKLAMRAEILGIQPFNAA